MFKKTLTLLIKNPILIVFYPAFSLLNLLLGFTLAPTIPSNASSEVLVSKAGTFLLYIFLISFINLVFTCCYGNMITEAIHESSTKPKSFFDGIKFLGKFLLAVLLLFAFVFGLIIILSIVSGVVFVSLSSDTPANQANLITILTIIMYIISIFVAPFIILWYPAIIFDNLGVIDGLKSGMKTGTKCYWSLVLAMACLFLPTIAMAIFNPSSDLANIIYFAVTVIIGLIFVSFIFLLYSNKREEIK